MSNQISFDLINDTQLALSHIKTLCLIATEIGYKNKHEMDTIFHFLEQQVDRIDTLLGSAKVIPETNHE